MKVRHFKIPNFSYCNPLITVDNQQKLIIGTESGVYRNIVNDTNWDYLGLNNEMIHSVAVNVNGDIYFTSAWPLGVVRSLDNGETFELINEGLSSGLKDNIVCNVEGFLYVTSIITLAKSINTTVSVSEKHLSTTNKRWIVYPNPIKDILTLKPNRDNKFSGMIKINIINQTGDIVTSKKILSSKNEIRLNLYNLISGMYLLEIESGDHVSYLKIIKK